MPRSRSFTTASAITAIAAAVAIGVSGGHSPFAAAATGDASQAPALIDPTSSPSELAVIPTVTPAPTHRPSKAPDRGANGSASSSGGSSGGAATPRPTPHSTPRPTAKPTAAPTPRPTQEPTAPPQASGNLSANADEGQVELAWTTCTSDSFAAYAVVRSTDSEIHYPAEDHDTLVALVTSRSATRLTDTGAPAGARVWYRVWCLSRSDGEYRTVWTTPTVSVTP